MNQHTIALFSSISNAKSSINGENMAHPTVLAEHMEFCDAFFPAPSHLQVARLKSSLLQLTQNPFAELLEAGTFSESVVRAQFVSHPFVPSGGWVWLMSTF